MQLICEAYDIMKRGLGMSYKGKSAVGAHSIEEFCAKLKKPRRMMLLVMAGPAVDDFFRLSAITSVLIPSRSSPNTPTTSTRSAPTPTLTGLAVVETCLLRPTTHNRSLRWPKLCCA